MRKISTFVYAALLLAGMCASPIPASQIEFQWFKEANDAYEKKDYQKAAEDYESVVRKNFHNSLVYYNLGNAYYKLGKLGLAALAYEKALLLEPRDPDTRANLDFVNLNTIDKTPPGNTGPIQVFLWQIHSFLSLNQGLAVLAVCWFLGWGLGILRLFAPPFWRPLVHYGLGITLAVFLGLGVSVIYKVRQQETYRSAVVLVPALEVRNAPDGDQVQFTVHEGTKFRINQQRGDWLLVNLPNGLHGWVGSHTLGEIKLTANIPGMAANGKL
jgi:tetratricopeptide (TPR) repeat protein